MRLSGDWRGKGGNEEGPVGCGGGGFGQGRVEVRIQGAQQSVQQQGIRVSAGVWGREG